MRFISSSVEATTAQWTSSSRPESGRSLTSPAKTVNSRSERAARSSLPRATSTVGMPARCISRASPMAHGAGAHQEQPARLRSFQLQQPGGRASAQPVEEREQDDDRERHRYEHLARLVKLFQAQREERGRSRGHDATRCHAGEESALPRLHRCRPDRAGDGDQGPHDQDQDERHAEDARQVVDDRPRFDPRRQHDEERSDEQREDRVAEDPQRPQADEVLVGQEDSHRRRGEESGLGAYLLGGDVGGHDEHHRHGHLEIGGDEQAAQRGDQQHGCHQTGGDAGQRDDDELAPDLAQCEVLDEDGVEAEHAQGRADGIDDDPLPGEDGRHRSTGAGQPEQGDDDGRARDHEDGSQHHRDPHRLVEEHCARHRGEHPGDEDSHRHQPRHRAADGGPELAEPQFEPAEEQQDAHAEGHHREQGIAEDLVRVDQPQPWTRHQPAGEQQHDRGEVEKPSQPLQTDP